ncbi:CRISPR-associated helicase Cas3' [Nitrosophilus alvini]|uniref:CRISPR-associated helicase Cas3' n=1 Tax=Nitrosophilus alvini TaxID=2714855 RepID=UPI001909C48F|nr:CRISPR-associated helicase Cas3' [Nitrosophilus alvini]
MGEKEFFAHIHPSKPPELLEEHKKLTKEYLQKILKNQNLEYILENQINSLKITDKKFAKELIYNAVILHDEGKKNPAFQAKKMKNEAFKVSKRANSNHSKLSSKEFIKLYLPKIKDESEFQKKLFLLLSLSYIISKHHSSLANFRDFIEEIENELRDEIKDFESFNLEPDQFDISIYIVTKFIFSLLISSDYYATLQYMSEIVTDDFGKVNIIELKKEFENFKIVRNVRAKNYQKPIDKLRSEMFLEAEKTLLKNLDKNIFYLKAPTGAGKTLISLNLALSFENVNKIFYIFPFNTLVEQTRSKIKEIFRSLNFMVINSITPIIEDEEKDTLQYEKVYLNRLFYHYPLILTTHVNFFDILFGTGKEANFPLWQLANSIIIIDEIQSYNNNLWWYMAEFFEKYAKLLNIKIIIMSATLPKIDSFLENKDIFVELLDSKKYFTHSLFKDRVDIDFSLLQKDVKFGDLKKIILGNDKVLIEFIKKDTARKFYEFIKDMKGYEIYELSGDDNKLIREYVINRTKKAKKIIVVATQVIEAGVDIDMDLGLKDISVLDSDEQFLGRINRNALKKGKVYFFDMDDAASVYRGDNRLAFSLKNKNIRNIFLEKDFDRFYEMVLNLIKKKEESYIGFTSKIESFLKSVRELEFDKIEKEMKLIKTQHLTIFFPYKIPLDGIYKKIFEKVDERFILQNHLDGKLIWEEFKRLNDIENFAKKEIERSKLNYLMQFFTFNLQFIKKIDIYSDMCCGIYLINEYEDFIDENLKFNRKKFLEKLNCEFEIL